MKTGKLFKEKKLRQEKTSCSLKIPNPSQSQYFLASQNLRMAHIYKTLGKLLSSNIPLLFTGETGTGKEALSRVVHENGRQCDGMYVVRDCKQIVDEKLFSDLLLSSLNDFYTKNGKYENSPDKLTGTVVLKNIERLPGHLQDELLLILQDKAIRLSEIDEKITLDIRIVATSQNDLWNFIAKDEFRKDLFYRLSIYDFTLPPLRERAIDIPNLVHHFCLLHSIITGKPRRIFSKRALALLKKHNWPENIRELRQVITNSLDVSPQSGRINEVKWPERGKGGTGLQYGLTSTQRSFEYINEHKNGSDSEINKGILASNIAKEA